MKLVKACFIFLLFLSLVHCAKEKPEELGSEPGLSLSLDKVSLDAETTFKKVKVLRATGNFTVYSSDEKVAQVRLIDGDIVIIGIARGRANILVRDQANEKVNIEVLVNGINRAPMQTHTIYVKKNTTRTIRHSYPTEEGFKLLGSLDNDFMQLSYVGEDKLKIEGKEFGFMDILVEQDYWIAASYRIKVVAIFPLQMNFHIWDTNKIGPQVVLGVIKVGNGGYKIESSDSSVAVATLKPYLSPNSQTPIDYYNESYISYETFGKVGKTKLTLTDAAGLKEESYLIFKAP